MVGETNQQAAGRTVSTVQSSAGSGGTVPVTDKASLPGCVAPRCKILQDTVLNLKRRATSKLRARDLPKFSRNVLE